MTDVKSQPVILAVSGLDLDFAGGAEIALHELLVEAREAGLPAVHFHPGATAETKSLRGVPVLPMERVFEHDIAAVLVNRGSRDDRNAMLFAAAAKARGIPVYQWMHDYMDTPLPGARVFAASKAHALASGLGADSVLTPVAGSPIALPEPSPRVPVLGPQVFVPSNAIGKGGDTAVTVAAWVDGWYAGLAGETGDKLGSLPAQSMAAVFTGDIELRPDRPTFWMGGAGAVPWQAIARPRNVLGFARMGSSWGQEAFRKMLVDMDLALVPTRQETFCRTIAECLELGLPVVASAIPAVVETFSLAATLVHPEAPARVWWCACLAVLRESAETRANRVRIGRALVVRLHAEARQQRERLFAEWRHALEAPAGRVNEATLDAVAKWGQES